VLPYLERLRDHLAIPMVYVSHRFEEVLRLADFLVLLERGRVLAQGTPQALCLRPELQALVGPEHVGALLEGTVRAVDAAGGAQVEVAGNTLHLAQAGLAVGERVRVQLLASDLILANQPVAGVSVRNALTGAIVDIAAAPCGSVLVECEVAGERVLARITPEARAALALEPGRPVWILVKAAALRAHPLRAPAS
jgi:molybdate transport system ATP-binding protein